MIRVAVSQRVDVIPGRDERRDAPRPAACRLSGPDRRVAPSMPNGLQARGLLTSWLNDLRPEGLVLSGGNDVGAEPDRDVSENVAIEWAMAARLPVLGLCRGMQSLECRRVGSWCAWTAMCGPACARRRDRAQREQLPRLRAFDCSERLPSARLRGGPPYRSDAPPSSPDRGWMWHPDARAEFSEDDLVRARRLLHSAQQAPELERSISRGHTWR